MWLGWAIPLAACAASGTGPPVTSTAQGPTDLAGTAWQLVQFMGGDDTVLTPADRSVYTLTFETGGQLTARVDCNRGRGTWKVAPPAGLELGPLALTRAAFPPAPLNTRLPRDYQYVRSFVMEKGHLFLSLFADGGIYEFEPLPPAAVP
jgi:para-nitrobenzyl esterase